MKYADECGNVLRIYLELGAVNVGREEVNMERPVSATSSSITAPSTITHAGHRRNPSTKIATLKPLGPSVVSLFITNLRLLNIDRYADWPNITIASFQDARGKIKCTEYALYQLFRLYDPHTAADKLQPFFPPLEPLQSVNLRAGLYRCLNELKKNGVLGRETVLRKTMLDECQGDKFWEVCLSFSAIVLRKVTVEKKRGSYVRPVAEKMGTAQAVSKSQRDSMLPLAIAHKGALNKVLEERGRKKETYTALFDILSAKKDELRQRKVKAEDQARKTRSLQPQKLNVVETVVMKNWIGSTDLRDALVEGDTCAKGDGMLVKSFDDLWQVRDIPGRPNSGGAEIGLLQSLSTRATEQNARLRKWQSYHEKLAASKPKSAQSSRPASGTQKGTLCFNKHRDLNLHDDLDERSAPPPPRRNRHTKASSYDQILTAMREELRKRSSQSSRSETAAPKISPGIKRSQTQPMPPRKPSLHLDASPGAIDPLARSPTAVPMRFGMGRRVASRSRSYQQPKVESQREPIQLKSELFSPLKGKRSSVSALSASSTRSSPIEEEAEQAISTSTSVGESGTGADGTADSATSSSEETSTSPGEDGGSHAEDGASETLNAIESKKPHLPPASKGARPSLAERTRLSLAFNSSEDVHGFLPSDAPKTSTPDEYPASITEEEDDHETKRFDRRTTLMERTRQSIALAPPANKSNNKRHSRSRTSIYPVNQFETPRKSAGVRRSTVGVDEHGEAEVGMGARKVTPMKDLLSPEAEYSSVFKSRPKIALSPVLSPKKGGRGRVSEVGLGDEDGE